MADADAVAVMTCVLLPLLLLPPLPQSFAVATCAAAIARTDSATF